MESTHSVCDRNSSNLENISVYTKRIVITQAGKATATHVHDVHIQSCMCCLELNKLSVQQNQNQ